MGSCGKNSVLVWAVITKYPRLGGFWTIEIYFLAFWNFKIKVPEITCLVRACLLVYRCPSSCVPAWQKKWESSLGSIFIRELIPFIRLHFQDLVTQRPNFQISSLCGFNLWFFGKGTCKHQSITYKKWSIKSLQKSVESSLYFAIWSVNKLQKSKHTPNTRPMNLPDNFT